MFFVKKKFFLMFIFETERVQAGEGQREGDTGSEAGSRLRAVSTEPNGGVEPTNREITTPSTDDFLNNTFSPACFITRMQYAIHRTYTRSTC